MLAAAFVTHLFVVFCPVMNDTQCRELEIAPADRALTMPVCMRGAMMGDQREFEMEGIQWRVRGARCEQVPTPIAETQAYLKSRVKP